MRTYDTYKDSGISWLGRIPSHWDVRRTKTIWEEHVSLSETGSEQLLSVSQYDGVKPNDEGSRSESLVGYKVVDSSNLVINIMLAWLGGLGVSQYKGIVSPAYCVYKLKENHCPEYFHYLYRTAMYLAEFARKSTGVVPSRWRMYTDSFGTVLSLVPPLAEQEAIVAYLDSATAEIDKAIASQQRMVELLQERKQIIINQAVTQGLNPDALMKPTNIDWLPQIPNHWDLRRLKYLLKSPLQYGANESPESTDTNLPRYIRITDIKENGKLNDDSFVSLSWEKAKDYLLQKGDILFARSGATVGKTYLFEEQYASCFAGYLIKARCNDGLLPKFLYLFTKSGVYDKWKESIFIKSTIQNIGADKYSNLPVPFPSYKEQKAVVEYIESTISPVNSAVSRCERIIALLTERKQILINDIVTGKIKVL